jgi:uncharacterized protein YqeY
MSLQERLTSDLKAALRARAALDRDVLRFTLSALQYEEKARGKPLDEQEALAVLQREARKRRESIKLFQQGGRQELVDKETAELAVLETYLPAQKSREEVTDLALQTIREVGATGPGDRGKVMGRLMPQLRGQADGALVNAVVSDLLDSLPNS